MKVPEKQALFRIGLLLIKGPTIPCRVPRWRFDLDDVGSQVSQYLGAQDARRIAQVKDPITTQRTRSVVAPSLHCCISPSSPVVSGWGHSQTTVVPLLAALWIASEAPIMLARYCILRSPMPVGLCATSWKPTPSSCIVSVVLCCPVARARTT